MGTLPRVLLTLVGGWVGTLVLFSFTLGVVAAGTGRSTSAGERAVVLSGLAYLAWSAASVGLGAWLSRGAGKAAWAAPLALGVALLLTAPLVLMGTLVVFNR